jgi:hypothetical protein
MAKNNKFKDSKKCEREELVHDWNYFEYRIISREHLEK